MQINISNPEKPKNTRNTLQRKIVLDALQQYQGHPTIDELYTAIQKNHPTISKTTIYRNLRLLHEAGAIHQVELSAGPVRFESSTDKHYHFQCSICQHIFDVDMQLSEDIDAAVAEKYGFLIQNHALIFSGICNDCKAIQE